MKFFHSVRRSLNKEESSMSSDVSRMLRFVQERNHVAMAYVFLTDDDDQVRELLQDCEKVVGEPFQHHMLKSQPTAQLVELVLARLGRGGGEGGGGRPDATVATTYKNNNDKAQLDSKGRTALHVAAAYGCGFPVIETLLRVGGLNQASARDDMNRTPLHWACSNPIGCNKTKRSSSSRSSRLDSVVALLEAFPNAIRVRDNDGNTPIGIARNEKADKEIIELLEASYRGKPKWLERGNVGATDLTLTIPRSSLEEEYFDDTSVSSIGWDHQNSDHTRCTI